jgi:hypothetical protein
MSTGEGEQVPSSANVDSRRRSRRSAWGRAASTQVDFPVPRGPNRKKLPVDRAAGLPIAIAGTQSPSHSEGSSRALVDAGDHIRLFTF